jgi:hypothetical protein
MPDSQEKWVDVLDTSFVNCHVIGGTNPSGGAVALAVQKLTMDRCCGRQCSSVNGQFLFLSHAPNSTIDSTNCYLCADPKDSASGFGSLEFDTGICVSTAVWNCTDCSLSSGDGAAVALYGDQIGEYLTDFRFATIIGCRARSMIYQTAGSGSRRGAFGSCNFVNNYGTLFIWRRGTATIRHSVFHGNCGFEDGAPLELAEVFMTTGSAKFSLLDSFIDFTLPIGSVGAFDQVQHNAGPGNYSTIPLYFMHTEACPRGPTGLFTASAMLSVSPSFARISALQNSRRVRTPFSVSSLLKKVMKLIQRLRIRSAPSGRLLSP